MKPLQLFGRLQFLGLLFFLGCSRPQQVPQSPYLNVLFITLDTTRADHLSCYEAERAEVSRKGAKTPQLDALAASGVRFAKAIVQVPLTLPSHACIFTGNYPEVHGLRDMIGFVLNPKQVTLASMVRTAGFRTAAFVGSRALDHQFGLRQGFEVYDDQMSSLRDVEGRLVLPERPAAATTDRALNWLRQHSGERFFLWVHFYDPHEPYDPPEPYKSTYAGDLYSGEIAYSDEQVGRLLEFLDQSDLRQRTLVIVMGDHGEGLNDHLENTHGVFIYDETLHVPLILAGPRVPRGRVIQTQVRSIDLLPTVVEFLSLPANPGVQGTSLWPLIEEGKPVIGKGSNYAYVETLYPKTFMNWSELRGMRTDRWKFILAPKPELYDLERDPTETKNVIDQHPAEADHLQKKVWEVIGPPQGDRKLALMPVDAQTRQELASLGYVNAGVGRELVLDMNGPDPKDRVRTLNALHRHQQLLKTKSFGEAERLLRDTLQKDPGNPMLRLYLGITEERQGAWRQAIETYRSAIEANIATDEVYSRLGKAYLRMNDINNAIIAMETAARKNPTDLENLCNLGTAYLLQKRPAEAEKAFKAVLLQDNRYSPAYNGLGLVAVQRGNLEAAGPNFERAIELDPKQVEPLLHLGLLYRDTGDREKALHYFTQFLEKAPHDYDHLLPQVRKAIQGLGPANEARAPRREPSSE
jgi:arylsulfatase A-like enzyme/tetratricopeptide (TPR) repeat protein